jgi:hypothetical protein
MKPFQKQMPRGSPEPNSGSVIIVVLLFVVLLSFIVVAFMEEAVSQIRYFSLFHQKDDLRVEAYSALETSLAVINEFREVEGSLWGPAQGWGNPLSYTDLAWPEGVGISVRFTDESGKFAFQDLTYETWLEIFRAQGFDLGVAEELADCLLDWTDEDDLKRLNGFDGEDYESLDLGYKPANGPIESFEEVLLIPAFQEHYLDEEGIPLPLWNEWKQAISLEGRGPVNLNSAAPLVRATLVEMGVLDPYALESWENGADGIAGTEDDRLLRNLGESGVLMGESSNLVSSEIRQLKIEIETTRGDARFLLTALVQWTGANPAANQGSPSPEESTEETNADANGDNASTRRREARGNTRTSTSSAANLGYPFQILHITENHKIS